VETGFLGLVRVGNEAADEVEEEGAWAAVPGVFDLGDVLELVVDRLNDGSLAQQEAIAGLHKALAHVLAQLGDKPHPLLDEKPLSERLRNGPLIPEETFGEEGNWLAVIHIPFGKADGEQLCGVIDYQMELEPREPAHRGLAASGIHREDPMLRDPGVRADGEGSRVHEAEPSAGATLALQIDGQREQDRRHELDKARVPGGETLPVNTAGRARCSTP
jgi:hypothetical protein